MSQTLVLAEVVEHIAVLTLNHPEKRNALSRIMLANLREHLARIANDRQVRVVILRRSTRPSSRSART
jgi:enoyl-CoA hydratase/carnithine racemase